MSENGTSEPLAGTTVAELATTFVGPYCAALMARMGAEVIKVESPGGDIVRAIGSGRNVGMGPIFLNAKHRKRSLALDLKQESGRPAMLWVLAGSDVFLTNMRPAALARLGLTHGDLEPLNPRLNHCVLPGVGSTGPYRNHAAYDVIQAISGAAAIQGGTGEREYVRAPGADKTVALMALSASSPPWSPGETPVAGSRWRYRCSRPWLPSLYWYSRAGMSCNRPRGRSATTDRIPVPQALPERRRPSHRRHLHRSPVGLVLRLHRPSRCGRWPAVQGRHRRDRAHRRPLPARRALACPAPASRKNLRACRAPHRGRPQDGSVAGAVLRAPGTSDPVGVPAR